MSVKWMKWNNSKYYGILITGVIMWGMFADSTFQTVLAPILPNLLLKLTDSPAEETTKMNLTLSTSTSTPSTSTGISSSDEGVEIGVLLAVKAYVQIIVSPFTGHYATRWGNDKTILLGLAIILVSSTVFAYGLVFWILLVSQLVHGLGSSCLRVAGLGALAQRFTDDKQRETMLGLILGAVILGEVMGLILGGFVFESLGQLKFFLFLTTFVFLGADPQLRDNEARVGLLHDSKSSSLLKLIMDPYIIIVSGCTFFGNIQFSMLQASLPIHMKKYMDATTWQTGVVFLPQCIAYLVGVLVFPHSCQRVKRWSAMQLGLCLSMISYILIFFATQFYQLLLIMVLVGLSSALIDVTTLTELAHLTDIRHTSAYAKIYSISEFAIWLGYAVGPTVGGILITAIGFFGIMMSSAIFCLVYISILYCTHSWFPLKAQPERV